MPVAVALAVAFALAAPVPAPLVETPRPRAKLLGTLYLDSWVQAAHWTPDGKHLILLSDSKVLIYPREALTPSAKSYPGEAVKPLTWFDRPDLDEIRLGGRTASALQMGPSADGGVWAVVPAGHRVSAENRLVVWERKTLFSGAENPKPDRSVDVEADNPQNVVPTSDGKHLLATLGRPLTRYDNFTGRQTWTDAPKFARLSTKTGDLLHTSSAADLSELPCVGCRFDSATGRLFLAWNDDEEWQMECRAADGGKVVWKRPLSGKPASDRPVEFTLSPDGGWVVVAHPSNVSVVLPLRNPRDRPQVIEECVYDLKLLDAKSGKAGPELGKEDNHTAHVYGFSADGRLLFGRVQSLDGREARMVVWDTKTGAEVKAWVREQPVLTAAFAPTGHNLLIVEQDNGRVLLGLWDLSPLVK